MKWWEHVLVVLATVVFVGLVVWAQDEMPKGNHPSVEAPMCKGTPSPMWQTC